MEPYAGHESLGRIESMVDYADIRVLVSALLVSIEVLFVI
jgi:hypothetical protein